MLQRCKTLKIGRKNRKKFGNHWITRKPGWLPAHQVFSALPRTASQFLPGYLLQPLIVRTSDCSPPPSLQGKRDGTNRRFSRSGVVVRDVEYAATVIIIMQSIIEIAITFPVKFRKLWFSVHWTMLANQSMWNMFSGLVWLQLLHNKHSSCRYRCL